MTWRYVTNISRKNRGFCSKKAVFSVNTRRKLNTHLTFITAWKVLVFGDFLVPIASHLRVQSECRKIRTRKTPSTGTFYTVHMTNSGLAFTVLGSRGMFRTLPNIYDRGFLWKHLTVFSSYIHKNLLLRYFKGF